ncbi:tRNA lysidine(34) synthetase TilS [Paracoccus sp. (in: a-proteobacteria)]|uniref:tRNA lysidine(34) synthetase TilS n=1 Tax=Paracoccus sp. TaxID=267 RepID=UPI0026DEE765|nr:tRNA lysidine(34) synthetase TilS [Paracoccus sp. (in: a-proteobacteria)]MDO5647890.1 tRNA lysidine(34) synthetase TilS [Paracoccus sp. (in: a-proteobacteria)]
MTWTPAAVHAALDRLAGDLPGLGLAVSGGGDSVALMHIAADWARGRRLMVATVDHGLRATSGAEAAAVAQAAAGLNLTHNTLIWRDNTAPGNLMANARDARLRLLSDWARRHDLPAVALGHTRDDIAETLLMRLARGAGIDGLAAMAERRESHDILWLRPMLDTGRDELRDWLRARGIAWIDDPTNDNTDFDRARVRRAMSELGLDPAALARSAQHLAGARDALTHYAAGVAQQAQADRGSLTLPRADFDAAPPDLRRRLLIAAVRWVTGADYPPRHTTQTHAIQALANGQRVTLDGTIITPRSDHLHITREPAAARRSGATCGPIWDHRWHITGLRAGQIIAATGDCARDFAWRDSGLSLPCATASPAIWQNGALIAAPLLQSHTDFIARPLRNTSHFISLAMAH